MKTGNGAPRTGGRAPQPADAQPAAGQRIERAYNAATVSMEPARWRRIEGLYHAAKARPAKERARFLAEACSDDEDLRRQVESLLDASGSADGLFAEPAVALAAQMIGDPERSVRSGQQLGVYRLKECIGAGGMGEVYRAFDTRLRRDVAIKILPPVFTADVDRLNRFEREARVLAALNHRNIATIHGVEESGGIRAIVMELVEGDTLARRIERGALPIASALNTARQIADALEAAHDKGIVHRDLKPANVKVTPDGTAKVLDFGLAKLEKAAGQAPAPWSTITLDGTQPGLIVGTAAYMSPEQARGDAINTRTDVWSFGALLFEMLSGRQAFGERTVSETLAAILSREPDWGALPAATPDAIRRLLRRCLEKDPQRRLRAIGDARLDIDDSTINAAGGPSAPGRDRSRPLLLAILAGIAVIAVGIPALIWSRASAPVSSSSDPSSAIRFSVDPPEGTEFSDQNFIVSPDGRSLAWVGLERDPPRRALWVRPLASMAAREVPGTVGATFPFWSPDGRSIGFFADDMLKRVDLTGGAPQALGPTPAVPLGAAWSPQDVIVFSARSVIYKVPAGGGPLEQVAAITRDFQEDSLRFPRFLPGGERFLYVARSGNRANSAVYVGSLDGRSTRLFPTSSQVEYSPPGYLLYVRNETLVARKFDPETLTIGSETVAVAESVGTLPTSIVAFFALSPNGPLLYQGNASQTSVLQWFDRSGRALQVISSPGVYRQFRRGPDGRRVAFAFDDDRDGRSSVWTLESERQVLTRLTFALTHDRDPIWSPDGQRIVFSSSRRGSYALYTKAAAGSGTEEELLASEDDLWPEDWTADGRFIAFRRARASTSTDVVLLPFSADRTPVPVAESPAAEHGGRFSPSSRWIAYVSAETGREEIFVEPVPPTGATWQISTEGGHEPAWRSDGRELFYLRPDGMLVSVEVTDDGTTFAWGAPRPLFRAGPPAGLAGNRYEVSRDGQSFLVAVPEGPSRPQPIMVVLNWLDELKQRLPPAR